MPTPVLERLWAKVDKSHPSGCWLWLGSTYRKGYGKIYAGPPRGFTQPVHRVVWEAIHGPIQDGLFVLHQCDNPRCVNPAHLHLGDNGQNMRECVTRGRHKVYRGSTNNRSKLTEEQVMQIRQLRQQGHKTRELAKQFHVSHSLIVEICNRQRWKHV